MNFVKIIKSRNLTRSERYNRNLHNIFDEKRKQDNAKAKFLKMKGLTDEEIQTLKDNTGLGSDALGEKIIELGFKEEFWNDYSNKKSSKNIKSGESYGWYVAPHEAQEKLDLWIEVVGVEQALDDLRYAMGNDELSENLAYIFRMNDFEEGQSKRDKGE